MALRDLYRWLKWWLFQPDIGNQPVHMIRHTLVDIPESALPAGYQIRPYQPGDEIHWRDIHIEADPYNEFTVERFKQVFGNEIEPLQTRQFYIINPNMEVVGTASAWWDDEDANCGRVHWVAILPSEQGNGLAKPLLTKIMHTFQQLGYQSAKLETGSVRLPAVNLYLKYGFEPNMISEDDPFVWRVIQYQLNKRRS